MKFHSNPIAEHEEAPVADDGRWEALIAHWEQRHGPPKTRPDGTNACYVVAVTHGKRASEEEADAAMAEVLGLVRAQGDDVVGHEAVHRERPDPRTFLGRGAAEQIAARATEQGADLIVVDCELSPSQTRNLEDTTGMAICDREAVILNVFALHAKTRKAKIQVEIAHLEYLRPRIRGLGLQMDQQAGGLTRARGPGETASELLARRLDGRLAELRKAFGRLRKSGQTQRRGREDCTRITLVGYTNAGKTSLMNALTHAGLSAKDMPFETLDTTSRSLSRHGGDVVLSDTVGFIRRLPTRLLASFESTLAEIHEASLVVLVVDAADPEAAMHLRTTEALITKLQGGQLPRLYVFNKIDKLDGPPSTPQLQRLSAGHPFATVCSHDEAGVEALREQMLALVRREHQRTKVFVPYGATELSNRAYATCRVFEAEATARGLVLTLEGPAHIVGQLKHESKTVQS